MRKLARRIDASVARPRGTVGAVPRSAACELLRAPASCLAAGTLLVGDSDLVSARARLNAFASVDDPVASQLQADASATVRGASALFGTGSRCVAGLRCEVALLRASARTRGDRFAQIPAERSAK